MIGDIVLWIKKFWKQQTCIHDYRIIIRKDTGGDFHSCFKCDKIN